MHIPIAASRITSNETFPYIALEMCASHFAAIELRLYLK